MGNQLSSASNAVSNVVTNVSQAISGNNSATAAAGGGGGGATLKKSVEEDHVVTGLAITNEDYEDRKLNKRSCLIRGCPEENPNHAQSFGYCAKHQKEFSASTEGVMVGSLGKNFCFCCFCPPIRTGTKSYDRGGCSYSTCACAQAGVCKSRPAFPTKSQKFKLSALPILRVAMFGQGKLAQMLREHFSIIVLCHKKMARFVEGEFVMRYCGTKEERKLILAAEKNQQEKIKKEQMERIQNHQKKEQQREGEGEGDEDSQQQQQQQQQQQEQYCTASDFVGFPETEIKDRIVFFETLLGGSAQCVISQNKMRMENALLTRETEEVRQQQKEQEKEIQDLVQQLEAAKKLIASRQ